MQRIGTLCVLIAVMLIIAYFGYQLASFPELPGLLRVAAAAGTIGLIAFIIAGMKDTWGKKDKYEEVEK